MHFHCEVVIPPLASGQIDEEYCRAAVAAVMSPFDENRDREECAGLPFWDWYVIGGRWAGAKMMARLGSERIDAFYVWLKEEGVTVSSFQAGKQEISPADQVPRVDAKWTEMFPEAPGACPLFKHSNDQYGAYLAGDICKLTEMPALDVERVIFAGPEYSNGDWTGPLEPKYMLCRSFWNGCNHMRAAWDGSFASAVEEYRKSLENSRPEYAAKIMPTDAWIAVTVDYHS